jgi:hypothetical protein
VAGVALKVLELVGDEIAEEVVEVGNRIGAWEHDVATLPADGSLAADDNGFLDD